MARTSGPKRQAITNLLGGVSQQPNTVRLGNQCEVQDNAYSSVVDGLGKRQPVEHVRRLTEITDRAPTPLGVGLDKTKTLVHWINRDPVERYSVVFDHNLGGAPNANNPGIFIFDVATGTRMTLGGKGLTAAGIPKGFDPTVKTYLETFDTSINGNSKNARRDLKVLTVADTTFILNKTVEAKMDTHELLPPFDAVPVPGSDPLRFVSKSARRWFLFQRTANALSQYAVELYTKTGDKHPQTLGKGVFDPPGADDIDGNKLALGWVKTFNLNYATRDPAGKGYGGPTDIPPYIPGSNIHEGYQIPTVQTHEVVERLWTEDGEGTISTTADAFYRGGLEFNYNRVKKLPFVNIGSMLVARKRLDPSDTNIILPQRGPVMMLELRLDEVETSLKWREELLLIVDSTGDLEDSLITFSSEVDKLSQLPLVCKHGHIVKITGLADNDSDEFYAEFEANEASTRATSVDDFLAEGHWKETMASLSKFRIDQTTMPLKLVRVNDAAQPLGFRFELYHADWTDKTVGDEDSNPDPSFIGKTIEDVFLWRNRLGFIAGSRFIMSEADEFENFWRTTVKTLTDSDPIDIDAGHSDVADLRFSTPLEEELVIWTDRTQFLVQGDPILTPKTASLTPATEFEAYPDVRPEVLENGIFYALRSGGGGFSQIRQFVRIETAAGSFTSLRSSEQIPRYIVGKIVEMTATSIESVLATRTDDSSSRNIIYIYKWHDDGPGRRILSSWFRYDVGPTASTTVHGMKFIEDDLFLIVERTTAGVTADKDRPINLEKITFSGQRQVDTGGSTFRCLLDRRITETLAVASPDPLTPAIEGVSFNYDNTTKSLDIELPYLVADGAGMKIVSRVGSATGPEGKQFAFTQLIEGDPSFTTLRIFDPLKTLFDMTQVAAGNTFLFHIGQDFTMTYQFSRFALREITAGQATQNVATGRVQLLMGTIPYEDTGFMQVDVSPALHANGTTIIDRTPRTYLVPMLETGLGSSYVGVVNVRDGRLQFGLRSEPKHIRIILTNNSPYPCNPKGIDYAYNYSRRSAMGAF